MVVQVANDVRDLLVPLASVLDVLLVSGVRVQKDGGTQIVAGRDLEGIALFRLAGPDPADLRALQVESDFRHHARAGFRSTSPRLFRLCFLTFAELLVFPARF